MLELVAEYLDRIQIKKLFFIFLRVSLTPV
ncbi:MAG: hypothetical protein JWR38_3824 [Mucilaginibacter sp.]|nr:hypothetical protein [Mucilaginibacter sp.]